MKKWTHMTVGSALGLKTRRRRRLAAVGCTSVVLAILGGVRYDVWRVTSGSMLPSLRAGSWIVSRAPTVREWSRNGAELKGRIVVLNRAGEDDVVKRLIAVAGERVKVCGGRAIVDGIVPASEAEAVLTSARACWPMEAGAGVGSAYSVPAGYIFVLGDNRGSSLDSRLFGPVRVEAVVGVVEAVWR